MPGLQGRKIVLLEPGQIHSRCHQYRGSRPAPECRVFGELFGKEGSEQGVHGRQRKEQRAAWMADQWPLPGDEKGNDQACVDQGVTAHPDQLRFQSIKDGHQEDERIDQGRVSQISVLQRKEQMLGKFLMMP